MARPHLPDDEAEIGSAHDDVVELGDDWLLGDETDGAPTWEEVVNEAAAADEDAGDDDAAATDLSDAEGSRDGRWTELNNAVPVLVDWALAVANHVAQEGGASIATVALAVRNGHEELFAARHYVDMGRGDGGAFVLGRILELDLLRIGERVDGVLSIDVLCDGIRRADERHIAVGNDPAVFGRHYQRLWKQALLELRRKDREMGVMFRNSSSVISAVAAILLAQRGVVLPPDGPPPDRVAEILRMLNDMGVPKLAQTMLKKTWGAPNTGDARTAASSRPSSKAMDQIFPGAPGADGPAAARGSCFDAWSLAGVTSPTRPIPWNYGFDLEPAEE